MQQEPIETTTTVTDIASVLHCRRSQMIITFLAVMALASVITFLWPTQYKTEIKILVKNDRPDLIVSANSTQGVEMRNEVDETQVNSEIELLTSKELLQRVALECGLDHLIGDPDHALALEKAVKRLGSSLTISAVKKSNIILVEYLDADPKRAVKVLAVLGDAYLDEHLKAHGTPGSYTAFQAASDQYRQRLSEAEKRMAEFQRSENVDLLERQKEAALQASTDSEIALKQAESDIEAHKQSIAGSQHILSAAPARITTQKKSSTNDYSIDHLTSILAEAQNRRTQLLTKYVPDDRLVQEVDKEIADTREALAQAHQVNGVEEQTDVNPLHQSLELDIAKQKAELAGLESRRETLLQQSHAYHSQLAKLSAVTVEFDDLVRLKKEAEDNYLLYQKKAEEARITETLDRQKVANVAIAENPVEPRKPFWPKRSLTLTIGGILALLLSVAGALVAEMLNDNFQTGADLEASTGLPILAITYRGEWLDQGHKAA